MPVIDMHFHTMWQGPNRTHKSTGISSAETPEEMRQLDRAAMDRNHVVKAVASGDQLHLYVSDLGKRLLPGIILPGFGETMAIGSLEPSPAVLRQMHKEGKLAVLAVLGLLWAHPQVIYAYLRRIVDAGFADRVMFGSDNMIWPGAIDVAVRRTAAPFLSDDQKRDILYRNAAKFLPLGDEVCRQ